MEKRLREGVTTGSCAAGAALASLLWQLNGECPEKVEILNPGRKGTDPSYMPGRLWSLRCY